MSSGHALVIGCAAGPTSSFGIEADSRAIVSQQVLATTVATANAARDTSGNYHMVEVAPDVLRAELEGAILHSAADPNNCNIVKMDLERWFHADPSSPAAHDAIAAFRADILPHATVLCTSVDDALALLESAGAPIPPPRGIPDVKLISIALRHLGPAHVVVQQEFVDEAEGVTSLQIGGD
ncbi:hypothetical protein PWT90_08442 [Aphanocladium album]|nr:hypothetical protein PWT90_08442 [Aphanocladium album]